MCKITMIDSGFRPYTTVAPQNRNFRDIKAIVEDQPLIPVARRLEESDRTLASFKILLYQYTLRSTVLASVAMHYNFFFGALGLTSITHPTIETELTQNSEKTNHKGHKGHKVRDL